MATGGTFYFNGTNITQLTGVRIAQGGYGNIIAFPALKEPPMTNWPDENGVEVDTSHLALAPTEVSIPFIAKTGSGLSNFKYTIADSSAVMTVPALNIAATGNEDSLRPLTLRYLSSSSNNAQTGFQIFTLRFMREPIPLPPLAAIPGHPFIRPSLYKIDGTAVSQFGLIVAEGRSSLTTFYTEKDTFIPSNNTAGYVNPPGYSNTNEITLKCYFSATSMSHFAQCYNALFSRLTAGIVILTHPAMGSYACLYKKTAGWKIHRLNTPFVEFTLTFTNLYPW